MIKESFDKLNTNQKYDAMFDVMKRHESLNGIVAVPPSIVTSTITGSEKSYILFPPGILKTIYFHIPPFETKAKSKKVELSVTFSELGKTSFGGKTYTLEDGSTSVSPNIELPSGGLYELSKTPAECVVYLCASFFTTDPKNWMKSTVNRKMFLEE
jgi:hypothetical protein